ncbi:MAG: hypothetical protein IPG89_12545 [Bacteroidetes bacterium]|nr:hypothetical protein [Bacteroidota bacterium]
MSELGDKSIINLIAAQLLIDHKLHSSSVHCSYYSCLQKMHDVLIENVGYSDTSLYAESSRNKVGSHEYIYGKVYENMVARRANNSEIQAFSRFFGDIKRHRVNADYTNNVIEDTKSNGALVLAKKINATLAKIFEGDKK